MGARRLRPAEANVTIASSRGENVAWHVCDMPTSSSDVRSQRYSRKTFAQAEFF